MVMDSQQLELGEHMSKQTPRLWRQLWQQLWSPSDEHGDSRLSVPLHNLMVVFVFGLAVAVLYILANSYTEMRFVELFVIMVGCAVGVTATFDVLSRWPSQLLFPLAQVLTVVLALVAVTHWTNSNNVRAVLAWSLGAHLCVLPIINKLWTVFLSRRGESDQLQRAQLLEAANRGEGDTLLIRVLELNGSMATVENLSPNANGLMSVAESVLGTRPRINRIYVVNQAIVVCRNSGGKSRGQWNRHLVGVGKVVGIGDRMEMALGQHAAGLGQLALLVTFGLSLLVSAFAIWVA